MVKRIGKGARLPMVLLQYHRDRDRRTTEGVSCNGLVAEAGVVWEGGKKPDAMGASTGSGANSTSGSLITYALFDRLPTGYLYLEQ